MVTDGWSGHPGLPGNPRDRKVVGDRKAHGILTWIHRVFSNLKRRAMGVCHGPRGKRFQRHLDESVFRRDRRRHRRASLNRLPGPAYDTQVLSGRSFW